MRKLTFPEINNLVVKYKGGNFFGKDLELFKKHLPTHPLVNDLARANQFTFESLDGQMLSALLLVVSMDDILQSRDTEAVSVGPVPFTVDQVRAIITNQTKMPESFLDKIDDDDFEKLLYLSESEIIANTTIAIEGGLSEVSKLLSGAFGYSEEYIQTLDPDYLLSLVFDAETDADVIATEQARIDNSKPESIDALKSMLAKEFDLDAESVAAIPEETLSFFMQRSRSEIIVGYRSYLEKNAEPTDASALPASTEKLEEIKQPEEAKAAPAPTKVKAVAAKTVVAETNSDKKKETKVKSSKK